MKPNQHITQGHHLRRSTSSTGTYTAYATDEDDSTSPVVFTDVNTNRYYKARAKTCADSDRKLCGAWSTATSALEVPAPTFPTLSPPTIAVGETGSVKASFTPPSTAYEYLLTLRWSNDSKNYQDMPNPAHLDHGDTLHMFTELIPENGGSYVAALSACIDDARKNCGSHVTSNAVSLPTNGIAPSGNLWVGEQMPITITAVSSGLTIGQAYTVRISVATTSGANIGNLRFNECGSTNTPLVTKDMAILTSNQDRTVSKTATLHSCGAATGTLSVKLLSGGTEVASHSRTTSAVHLPTGVRVNGHGSSINNQFVVRWDTVATATSYKIRYAIADNASGYVTEGADRSWTEVDHSGSDAETTVTSLTAGRIYEVQVKPIRGNVQTGWSEGAYVKPTSALPAFTSTPKPKFAQIPIQRYWPSGNYTYHLCRNRFADPDNNAPSVWMNAIRAAVDAIVNGVVWQTDDTNIISATGIVDTDCTEAEVTGITWHNAVLLASNIAELMTYCGVEKDDKNTLACAVSHPMGGGVAVSGHVVFRPASLHRNWNPAESNSDPASCSKLFGVALHEFGHIFGLGHPPDSVDSVMYRYFVADSCRLKALDVGALMNIYQSVPTDAQGVE